MQEILAENLQDFFNNTKLDGKQTYKGEDYEVWEVSDEVFKSMCDLNDEDFEKLCPEGMWRSAIGSNMGRPDVEYKIKNNTILAWDGNSRSDYESECKECSDRKNGTCEGTEDDFIECFGAREYSGLLEYLCEELGASQPRNVCALAVDLAKYNNMTMGELFTKYEG